jgi:hypothetical protein|eukprot:COSAG01_NODE_5188_length_4423_cov_6.890148_3_plen_43_part_00
MVALLKAAQLFIKTLNRDVGKSLYLEQAPRLERPTPLPDGGA